VQRGDVFLAREPAAVFQAISEAPPHFLLCPPTHLVSFLRALLCSWLRPLLLLPVVGAETKKTFYLEKAQKASQSIGLDERNPDCAGVYGAFLSLS
jgi:hypothetical protein